MITGPAAALSHGIQAPRSEFVDVLVPLMRQRQDSGFARLHRTSRMPDRVYDLGPIRFSLALRAVADTVRGLTSLRDVRAVVADAVQRRRCDIQGLVAELSAGPSAGSALFREALGDVAEGIRSAAEGDLKDLLAKSRLPTPLFNGSVYDGETFVARPDAWWPRYGVAVEVDSHQWHLSPHDHDRTLERQRRMAKLGLLVLPFTPGQIRTEQAEVLAAIPDALGSARDRRLPKLHTVAA